MARVGTRGREIFFGRVFGSDPESLDFVSASYAGFAPKVRIIIGLKTAFERRCESSTEYTVHCVKQ